MEANFYYLRNQRSIMAGLYIHIPFCKSRCTYCSFFSTTRNELHDVYVEALCSEIMQRRDYLPKNTVNTLYIGGGTPSQLEYSHLDRILETADKAFGLADAMEKTIECNPDDLTPSYISGLYRLGFNRISMGIQSFDDTILKKLNRRHTALQAVKAVKACQESGFSNINTDLMYGLPGQKTSDFIYDINKIISLGVTHISAYSLTIEEGTPLAKEIEQDQTIQATDTLYEEMFNTLCTTLHNAGFEHYEISNFALPGFHSRHNSNYWDGTPYLGFGAGAHSFDGMVRRWNVPDLDRYISSVRTGQAESESEELSEKDQYNEMIMLSLRTSQGVSLDKMRERFGQDAVTRFLDEASPWIKKKDLVRSGNSVHFSEPSLYISDGIISRLFRD